MTSPEKLLAAEDNWQTAIGRWFPGERVVIRGKDLFTELKDMRWMELMLFAITGRHFSENEIRLFEGIWVLCTSYPDPRLWNNRVASLAGTVRSTPTLALSGANALSEAEIYGRKPDVRAYDFLVRCKERLELTNIKLEEIIQQELKAHRVIAGYGRPLINQDERIKPLSNLLEKLGLDIGAHLNLANKIEATLLEGRWRMKMNIAAPIAAIAADRGLSRNEFLHYMCLCFTGGMLPCFMDALDKTEGTFLPIRCNKVSYEGKNIRNW
ncbi:hypothetical protein JYT96_02630 [Gammaproteobacteria bacterium AH-315-C21]|nr:hypothetical protein [Gammaproteobacteria bacterium AH-315-C21]